MKPGFPYFIAAEFALFQSVRKVTLPHLLVAVSFPLTAVLVFRFLEGSPWWVAALAASAAGLLSACLLFRLFRLVLPFLRKLVAWGIIAPPDQARFSGKVISYLGRGGTVGR